MSLSDEQKKRRGRNWAVGGFLFAMTVLFYLATIAKIQEEFGVSG